jgi:FlaA1/EpsC-like NDP-sugar epimerase
LGADALVIIVQYYRNWERYILVHSLLSIINILTVIVVVVVIVLDSSYLFNYEGWITMTTSTHIHYVFGMIFIFTIAGIQVLGLFIKSGVESTQDLPEKTIQKKKMHRIFGYAFYTLSKAQLMLG